MKMYKPNYANNIKMRAKQMFRKFGKAVVFGTGRASSKRVLKPQRRRLVLTIIEEFTRYIWIDDDDVVRFTYTITMMIIQIEW